MLLDTGSEISLLKNFPGLDINEDYTVKINGINSEDLQSLGVVGLNFEFFPSVGNNSSLLHKFHVFEDVNIQVDGILGNDFLKDNKFSIDYEKERIYNESVRTTLYFETPYRMYLPPRSETIVRIPIGGNLDVGYIEKKELVPGCFVSDCITRKINDMGVVTVLNTNERFIRLNVPPFELNPIPKIKYQINSVNKHTSNENKKRWDEIKSNLRTDHLNKEEKDSIMEISEKFQDLFHLENDSLTCTTVLEHHIPLEKEASPICAKTYRYPKVHENEVNTQIETMLQNEIIKPSNSPWSSPLWVVPKKLDSSGKMKWRVVIDYRKLNEKTIGDNFPLPNITDILDQLGHSKYFTTLDLASGFHQIPLSKEDMSKTAFSTPTGHFEFTRMPFGLKNAPSCFQRLMNTVLAGIQGIKCFVYLDDVVVYASSLQDHKDKLTSVFNQLRAANLKLQPDKCEFLRQEVVYLGHIISKDGLRPNPDKISVIEKFPIPTTPKHIKQFLGLVGYYRRFIADFSKISQKLTKLLRKDVVFKWEEEQQEAFDILRRALMTEPILQYPDFDKEFYLTTDASNFAIGAILSQMHGDKLLPIAYASRTLNKAEGNYSTTEKECLAIVWSVNNFRPYLYGQKFIIQTDHKPLTWLFNVKDPGSRLVRWRLKLEEYNYEIRYKKGLLNSQADCLSRIEVNAFETEDEIRNILRESCNNNENNNELNVERDNENESMDIGKILSKPNKEYSDGVIINFTDSFFESPTYSNNLMTLKEKEALSKENTSVGEIIKFEISKQKTIHVIIKTNQWEDSDLTKTYEIIDELGRVIRRYNKIYIAEVNDINKKRIINYIQDKFKDTNTTIKLIEKNNLIIPKPDEIKQILKETHNTPCGGHAGIIRMIKTIKGKYIWKNMNKDIEKFVRSCPRCQINKINRRPIKNPMLITTTSSKTFQRVALDIFGPLKETSKGNKYVLSLQDDLTKFTLFIPIPNQEARTIADAFFRNFISKFGIPTSILTDQGQNFMGFVLQNLCKILKIKKLNTTPYHPQCNGALERVHATLAEYLRNFTERDNSWDQILDFASFAYNTNVHSSTNYTPYELVFGYKPEIPTSLYSTNEYTYDEYNNYLKNKITLTQRIAKENILKNKEKSKLNYDKHVNQKKYKIGDKILIKTPNRGKFDSLYDGPYTVISVNDVYVKIKRRNKIITYNINNTKPYISE